MEGTVHLALLGIICLAAIFVVLLGILTALKDGFNQVIKGLESIDERLSANPPAPSSTGGAPRASRRSRPSPKGPATPKNK